MRSLSRLLAPERIIWISGRTRKKILEELSEIVERDNDSLSKDETVKALLEREELNSTAIGLGLALPHARIEKIRDFTVVLGIHPQGVDFNAFDNQLVHVFALIIGPSSEDDLYVQILSRITRFLRDKKEAILAAKATEDIYEMTLDY